MPYIAVVAREDRLREVEAYRYAGIVGVTDTVIPHYSEGLRVVLWVANESIVAQNQADRLSSGMFGARVCETVQDLDAFILEVAP